MTSRSTLSRPNFSVCMATFNGEAYVREQLESISTNLEPTDELIVVDDASEDATCTIVQETFAKKPDLDARLVVLPSNRGHRAAFAHAVSLASRPLIALSDQDDLWPPDRLWPLAEALTTAEADLCFGSLRSFGYGPTQLLSNPRRHARGWQGLLTFLTAPSGHFLSFGSACAFRLDMVNPSLPVLTETHEAWLIAQALARHGVCYLPTVVTIRRLHAGNQTARRALPVRVRARVHTARHMTAIFRDARATSG